MYAHISTKFLPYNINAGAHAKNFNLPEMQWSSCSLNDTCCQSGLKYSAVADSASSLSLIFLYRIISELFDLLGKVLC